MFFFSPHSNQNHLKCGRGDLLKKCVKNIQKLLGVRERARFQGCSPPLPPASIVFRCWVYKYPTSPPGPTQPSRNLSAPSPLRPNPLSSLLLVQLPLTPPPPPPPLTSLLHPLIRISGLVRASSLGGPLIQKLILSDVTSQCQGDRC